MFRPAILKIGNVVGARSWKGCSSSELSLYRINSLRPRNPTTWTVPSLDRNNSDRCCLHSGRRFNSRRQYLRHEGTVCQNTEIADLVKLASACAVSTHKGLISAVVHLELALGVSTPAPVSSLMDICQEAHRCPAMMQGVIGTCADGGFH